MTIEVMISALNPKEDFMSRSIYLSIAFSFFIALLVFSPYPAVAKGAGQPYRGQALTAGEINDLFSNKTVEAKYTGKKSPIFIYYSSGGDLNVVKRNRLYKGQWWSKKNGRLCTQLPSDSRKCRIISEDQGVYRQYIAKKDGKHKLEMAFIAFYEGDQLKNLVKGPFLPEGTLTKRELKKLFAGKTVESETAVKKRLSLTYYSVDGQVEQLRNGKKRYGHWRIRKDDRICLQMEGAKEKCRIVVKEDGVYKKYIVKKNGRHQLTVNYRSFADR